jgi:hypothetical protein
MAAGPGAFTPESNHDIDDLPAVKCFFPDCSLRPRANSHLCLVHATETLGGSSASKTAQSHDVLHNTSKTRLPPEHEPGSVLGIARRKTGAKVLSTEPEPGSVLPVTRRKTGTTGLSAGLHPRSSPSAASQKPTTNGGSSSSPQKQMPYKRDAMSPPDSSHETGPPRKKARHDAAPSESAAGNRKQKKQENGAKPKQPRKNIYAKQAPGPALQFEKDVSNQPDILALTTNPNPSIDGNALSISPPADAGNVNQGVRDWFIQSKPAVSVNGRRSSSIADRPSVSKSTSSVVEEQKAAPEEKWRLPLSREEPSPITKPPPSRRLFLEELLFKEPAPRQELSLEQPQPIVPPSPRQPSLEELLFRKPPPRSPVEELDRISSTLLKPLASTVSELDFDSLVYSQEGAAPPPPGVSVRPKVRPSPPKPLVDREEGPFFMHIDPRLHWPQPHSDEWHAKKQEEIKARGGRKANFGKVVERLRARGPVSFEETLPLKFRDNPDLVRALEALEVKGLAAEKARRAAGSRRAQREKPILKRHASAPDASISKL